MSHPSFGELGGEDPYVILGVTPDAGEDEIREARRRLLRRHHPDLPGGDLERTQMVTAASHILLDPLRRRCYEDMVTELAQKRTLAQKPTFSGVASGGPTGRRRASGHGDQARQRPGRFDRADWNGTDTRTAHRQARRAAEVPWPGRHSREHPTAAGITVESPAPDPSTAEPTPVDPSAVGSSTARRSAEGGAGASTAEPATHASSVPASVAPTGRRAAARRDRRRSPSPRDLEESDGIGDGRPTRSSRHRRWSRLAVVAALSVATLTPISLFLGLGALAEIQRSGRRGRGFAIFAMGMGVVTFATWLLILVSALDPILRR